jgi:hypothetical protein
VKLLAAVALLAALIASGAARADTVTGDNVRIGFRAWILPQALPRGDPSPVSLRFTGRVHPLGEQRPSALRRVTIQVNRHAVFSTRGLPRCRRSRLVATRTSEAVALCGPALIGSGRFRSHIDIPEQAPFPAVGRVLAFNTTLHGHRAVALHISGIDPVPTTTVLVATLTGSGPTPGQFGSELTIEMPTIGDEWGYVTGFDLTLHRRYRYRGRAMSVVRASCPAPAGFDRVPFKAARGIFELADGQTLTRTLSGSCRAASRSSAGDPRPSAAGGTPRSPTRTSFARSPATAHR